MSEQAATPGRQWRFCVPFLIGDGLLLGAAGVIFQQAHRPLVPYEVAGFALCVLAGAGLGVWPFFLRHRAELRLAEVGELRGTLAQIQQLETIAGKIAHATGQWQTVHEYAVKVGDAARQIAERMSAESRDFFAFLEKANDAERKHLRLEVEKLRRGEGEWLQVLVRLLDHVYALYLAATRSQQRALIEQIGPSRMPVATRHAGWAWYR